MKRPDICTLSPDTMGRFNWREACCKHDELYASGEVSRWRADKELWQEMTEEVEELEPRSVIKLKGYVIACVYWLAVRLFGWIWWQS